MLTRENAVQFAKSISRLDNIMDGLRKEAHKLVHKALAKFGFQEAVKDFCNSM